MQQMSKLKDFYIILLIYIQLLSKNQEEYNFEIK